MGKGLILSHTKPDLGTCVQTVVGHPVRMNARHSSLWNAPTDSKADRVSRHIRTLKMEMELVSQTPVLEPPDVAVT
jgi:hypothetical protein